MKSLKSQPQSHSPTPHLPLIILLNVTFPTSQIPQHQLLRMFCSLHQSQYPYPIRTVALFTCPYFVTLLPHWTLNSPASSPLPVSPRDDISLLLNPHPFTSFLNSKNWSPHRSLLLLSYQTCTLMLISNHLLNSSSHILENQTFPWDHAVSPC